MGNSISGLLPAPLRTWSCREGEHNKGNNIENKLLKEQNKTGSGGDGNNFPADHRSLSSVFCDSVFNQDEVKHRSLHL